MKRKNLLTVWAKRVLPMFAMVGAGLMIGCNKPVDDPYAEPIDPVMVLKFGAEIGYDAIQYNNIMKYANDPRITKIIYFVDSTNNNNDYTAYRSASISVLRESLQDCLDYTPKATGGGTFIFWPGITPEDEAWFKANNWNVKTR